MAKFINKKEQVFDLRLTSYGRYLFSVGTFKPAYYAFYDDNVVYDKRYTHASASENQNNVHNRIKNETQYLESLVLFRDVEETLNSTVGASTEWYNQIDITPRMLEPAPDVFRFNAPLGDAYLDGPTQYAPAWKIAGLQTRITSSNPQDTTNGTNIPQLDIRATYIKRTVDDEYDYDPLGPRRMSGRTNVFEDEKVIELVNNDPLYYIEEVNTETLTKNFEIEVFLVITSSVSGTAETLERKYFRREIPQVQNGYLMSEAPKTVTSDMLTTGSIEYYFDVLLDTQVNQKLACKGAEVFNKESYYVDIDFECGEDKQENLLYDIYGSVTEPEICQ
tara:strand:+ start:9367 stop:10368 length:1002 start_codon:yes stop_codon:yes gene_type:complete